jgi:hypothetical protein
MSAPLSVAALFAVSTAAEIFEYGLSLARIVGLPVTSWRTGDPTRSLYKYLANVLAALETSNADYIRAGFLSTASGDWLTVLALETFGVTRTEATHATPTVTVTNSGGGFYEIEAGDLTFRASGIDKTYHNTSGGTLSAGATVTFDLVADEAGSDSSVEADEVDALVTTLLGVEVDSSTAAIANDEQSDEELREQCGDTLGALSPNGPADAYEYVCRNPDLTGVTDITRAKTVDDSDTGDVIVYVAGPSGPVAGASVTAAQDAVEEWATPNCITPTVTNCTVTTISVTATISGADIPGDFEDRIEDALESLFASIDIGGTVAVSAIISTIHNTLVAAGATGVIVNLTIPAANVPMATDAVPQLNVVTITEV